jgi:hypothetical protein
LFAMSDWAACSSIIIAGLPELARYSTRAQSPQSLLRQSLATSQVSVAESHCEPSKTLHVGPNSSVVGSKSVEFPRKKPSDEFLDLTGHFETVEGSESKLFQAIQTFVQTLFADCDRLVSYVSESRRFHECDTSQIRACTSQELGGPPREEYLASSAKAKLPSVDGRIPTIATLRQSAMRFDQVTAEGATVSHRHDG